MTARSPAAVFVHDRCARESSEYLGKERSALVEDVARRPLPSTTPARRRAAAADRTGSTAAVVRRLTRFLAR